MMKIVYCIPSLAVDEERIEMGNSVSLNIQRYDIGHVSLLWRDLFENLMLNRK